MAKRVCSALGLDQYEKTGSCFTLEALQELARAYNRRGKDTIDISLDHASLHKELTQRLAKECGTDATKEVRWIKALGSSKAAKMVMPIKPREWDKNPHTWLNNFDIENVLSRLEGDKEYPYKLLGVFPIDFQGKDAYNQILYPEMYNFDIKEYIGKYKYLGLITNLDTHDGPGTHWTSTFIVIDPKLKSFGAYYYDSTFSTRTPLERVPKSILAFFKMLKKQAEALPEARGRKFKNIFFKLGHQRGNTECGMFSIYYQVNWLNKLIKNINTTHRDIIKHEKYAINTDEKVWKLRNFFFPDPAIKK